MVRLHVVKRGGQWIVFLVPPLDPIKRIYCGSSHAEAIEFIDHFRHREPA